MKMRPNANLGQQEYNTKDSTNCEHFVCMLAASLLVVGRTFLSVFSFFTAAPDAIGRGLIIREPQELQDTAIFALCAMCCLSNCLLCASVELSKTQRIYFAKWSA